MANDRVIRTCIFCNGGPMTKEHAWPRWIRELYPGNESWSHELLDQDGNVLRGRKSDSIDVEVRRVCKQCNNGWMSSLESIAPLLTRLARGESTELTATEQGKLARWLVKTGLMIDLATPKPTISIESYHALFRGDPNEFTVVLLSSFPTDEAGADLSCMMQGNRITAKWWSPTRGDHLGSPARYYLQTLKLGLFIGQIFWTDDLALAYAFVRDANSRGHIRAWPKPSEARWPTTEIVGFDAFKVFGKRLAGWPLG